MQQKPNAESVNSLIDAARKQALGATEDFNNRLQGIVDEAAELSRLEILPSGIRMALARIAKGAGSENQQINSLLTRKLSHEHCRILNYPSATSS